VAPFAPAKHFKVSLVYYDNATAFLLMNHLH